MATIIYDDETTFDALNDNGLWKPGSCPCPEPS